MGESQRDPGRAAPRNEPVDLDAIPHSPRRPSERARDLIFAYRGRQKVLLWLGLAFAVMGVPFTVIFCWGLPVDIAIASASKTVAAQATDTELRTDVKVNGRHATLIRFRYELDGESYQGESTTLDRDLIASARAGEPLDAEVYASHPEWARLAGTTYSIFGYSTSFVVLFPILGVAMTFIAVRQNRREIHAFTHGVPVSARVRFAGPDTTTQINGRHPFKIEWEFEAGDGHLYSGSISNMRSSTLEPLGARSEIAVLYERMNPRINTVYIE